MADMTELIDRYIAVWNEPDATKRDAIVAEIWREDAFAASVIIPAAQLRWSRPPTMPGPAPE